MGLPNLRSILPAEEPQSSSWADELNGKFEKSWALKLGLPVAVVQALFRTNFLDWPFHYRLRLLKAQARMKIINSS